MGHPLVSLHIYESNEQWAVVADQVLPKRFLYVEDSTVIKIVTSIPTEAIKVSVHASDMSTEEQTMMDAAESDTQDATLDEPERVGEDAPLERLSSGELDQLDEPPAPSEDQSFILTNFLKGITLSIRGKLKLRVVQARLRLENASDFDKFTRKIEKEILSHGFKLSSDENPLPLTYMELASRPLYDMQRLFVLIDEELYSLDNAPYRIDSLKELQGLVAEVLSSLSVESNFTGDVNVEQFRETFAEEISGRIEDCLGRSLTCNIEQKFRL